MGISMLLTLAKSKQMFLLTLVLLTFGACKQSEFYDKSGLLGAAKTGAGAGSSSPATSDGSATPTTTDGSSTPTASSGTTAPTSNDGSSTPSTSTGSSTPTTVDGSNGGSTGGTVTPPPVVTNPPVVVNPPVIVSPPVVVNPPEVKPSCGGGDDKNDKNDKDDCDDLGLPLDEHSETFTQNSNRNGDVDILWVVDDSGSMADNQQNLADNFDHFITQFLEKDIDFKMGITTTDAYFRNGKMVGDSSKLTSASAKGNQTAFANNFTKWVKVGTNGSGTEQGMKCASGFFDRYASSFLRDDAYLAIVFVSDENDQSDKKVSEYLDRFQALKKNKGMVKTYSIVTTRMPKHAEWESIGDRYMEMSKATGGLYSDITDDFSATLKDIGGSIVNLIDHFALGEIPYNSNIKVLVNGVQVTSGWVYDSVAHTLKFNADSIPAEGSKIEIRYKVKANVIGAI